MPVSPPRPKMPHLNALRAFEAAARLRSIATAAEELCVTPAAVAQQVKSLEAWAGEKLFKRNPQGVELTPLGASVLGEFQTAFDALGTAVQTLRSQAAPREIRIAALPSIAQLWLSPRLPAIRKAMPQVSISVTAMELRPNLIREPFDLSIFFEEEPDVEANVIVCQDRIFPVCSPTIAAKLSTIINLSSEVFLHDSTWNQDWGIWLSATAEHQNLRKSGPEFSLYSLALEECKNGAGVLIGHEALVSPLVQSGDLVQPFDRAVVLPQHLTIATSKVLKQTSAARSVVDMLVGPQSESLPSSD